MKNIFCIIVVLILSCPARADKPMTGFAEIDKKALEIPASQTTNTADIAAYIMANFSTQTAKVRAAFIWTASTFEYDIENMYAINFHEKEEEKIAKTLKTHKGICENYAAVFNDICTKCKLRSYVVAGYTKQNGSASYLPHAWCAVMVDNEWYLFDPTWGSGFESDNKFVRKINNYFFMARPADLIRSHMPFDPMWELLHYPITNQEFYEGKTEPNTSKPYFSFADSINVYEQLDETAQYKAAVRRTEANGIKNGIIYDRLANLKQAIEINRQTEEVNTHNNKINTYNDAVADYNNAISDFNDFIQYRNARFMPPKTDAQIQGMIDSADNKIVRAKRKLASIKEPNSSLGAMMSSLQKMITEATGAVDEQKDFVAKYLSKGKLGRKTMFLNLPR